MSNNLSVEETRNHLVRDHLDQIVKDNLIDVTATDTLWTGQFNGGKCTISKTGATRGSVTYLNGQGPQDAREGDILSLIWVAQGFTNYGQAVQFTKGFYLGIDVDDFSDAQQRQFAERRIAQTASAQRRAARDDFRADRRHNQVQAIWDACKPIKGRIAERYLVSCGLPPQAWPGCLRFHSGLHCSEGGDRWPALVCRVNDTANELVGLWRIFLNGNTGALADLDKPRRALGRCKGNAVQFGPAQETLCLTIDVEAALTIQGAEGMRWPVWATLSDRNLMQIILPETVQHVRLYLNDTCALAPKTENELNGRSSTLAEQLRERLLKDSVEVTVHAVPTMGNSPQAPV